ncbi:MULTISPECIES: HAD family hydrolase [unclassified Streptomyces]|uniref:HAD family hydrolase n=1 Tax=unclassified Streptomyces TaxID=2593676 RepID=UPI00224F70B6|nr:MULTISPECIES: HAD family hydrolase [unclassified Streptomyces]MCX4990058.1 HAD family hydrolase [Streptomyces sp. NBC_00568]MCX5004712.1 HAD family hydrolase [Streptomyces sp. NBC_00638]
MAVDVDEIEDVRALLATARGVLFDFDGPVCRLFPDDSSLPVADELRELVAREGARGLLTAGEARDKDPHAVLRAVHRGRRGHEGLVGVLEERVSVRELDAARRAMPTPDAAQLIRTLSGRGLRLAVVTNNSSRAASYYLESHGLRGCFDVVHGRTRDVHLMKPHPDVVIRALRSLGLRPEDAVMIGDSPADVGAAARAGVRFIGYGRNARKESGLRDAGATVVLSSYALLLDEA